MAQEASGSRHSILDTIKLEGLEVPVWKPEELLPYSNQRLMVKKVVAAIERKENALIESPTGSGKTLGLLMGLCAWLHAHKNAARGVGNGSLHDITNNSSLGDSGFDESISDYSREGEGSDCLQGVNDSSPSSSSSSMMAGMINCLGVSSPDGYSNADASSSENSHEETFGEESANQSASEWNSLCACTPTLSTQRTIIYYATRTHKQIAQVVAEYSRLPYATRPSTSSIDKAALSEENGLEEWEPLNHTILASRANYCVNSGVTHNYRFSEDGIDGRCRDLCESKEGCAFKNNLEQKFGEPHDPANVTKMRVDVAKLQHNGPAFDIEDLKGTMQWMECCPYFASKYLHSDADIVFCPFNYLIDPGVRKASKIKLEGAIVVLDEAHNIENACRDASSFAFDENTLEQCLADVANKRDSLAKKVGELSSKGVLPEELDGIASAHFRSLEKIETFLENLRQLIKSLVLLVTGVGKRLPHTFNHEQLEESLRNGDLFLYAQAKQELKGVVDEFTRINKRQDEKGKIDNLHRLLLAVAKPSRVTLRNVRYFLVFTRFFKKEEYRRFYKCHISRPHPNALFSSASQVSWQTPSSFDSKRPRLNDSLQAVKLEFWCMSPSVAFHQAFKKTRTVVLASGSPLESVKRELGVPFSNPMHGAPVIPHKQVFFSIITRGPKGRLLYGTQQGRTDDYMAELRRTILRICETVEGGVLCFLPSYQVVDQLLHDGVFLKKLKEIKHLVQEPRFASELESKFHTYREAVMNPAQHGPQCTGAIMVAVCRGKVSEGIDFADEMARCVIVVGIPYPNMSDEKVKAKQAFNDAMCLTDRTYLTGKAWLNNEAFRPLNQALGRCLRHRNDWGALLLVESRMKNPDNLKLISQWVTNGMETSTASPSNYSLVSGDQQSFENTMQKLADFCTKMRLRDERRDGVIPV